MLGTKIVELGIAASDVDIALRKDSRINAKYNFLLEGSSTPSDDVVPNPTKKQKVFSQCVLFGLKNVLILLI